MVCPVYKNKKVRELFNEIISALGGRPMTEQEFASVELRNLRNGRDYSAMEAAYRIWNLNNGNPIDCTPNMLEETPSILFRTLLDLHDGDRAAAIREKSKVYSKAFIEQFGDWTGNYEPSLDTSGVTKTVLPNGKIRLSLDSHTDEHPRQIVMESQGNDKFYVHVRIWDGEKVPGKITNEDKLKLFNALYKELPVGAEILLPKSAEGYYATRGTIAAMTRLSRDNRFKKGAPGTVLYKDGEKIKEYSGTSFIKVGYSNVSKEVDKNGEPLASVVFTPRYNLIHNLAVGEKGARQFDEEDNVSTRIDNLARAKSEWENVKNLPKELRREKMLAIKFVYGWELGVDGKWRYEIPDVTLKKDKYGDLAIREVVGSTRSSAVTRSIDEVVDLDNLPPTFREELEYVGKISIYDDFSYAERGSYITKDGEILFTINLGADETPESILAHEFQHYVQEREGFLPGGNTNDSLDYYLKQKGLYDVYHKLLNYKDSYNSTLMRICSSDTLYTKYERLSRKLDQLLDMINIEEEGPEEIDKFILDNIPEELKSTYEEIIDHRDNIDNLMGSRRKYLISKHHQELSEAEQRDKLRYEELLKIELSLPSSYEAYKRLVGEVEARAVGQRTEMSAEQRKNSLVTDTMFDDVAEDDLIFVRDEPSDTALFSKADFSSTFGGDIWQRLLSGEQVSSQELFEYGIADRGVFHGNLQGMARVLSKHDIPVMISESLSEGTVATTMTDEDGNSVIMINPDWINTVSKSRQGEIIVHEMIHAITANALNAPKTATEERFKKRTYKVFSQLKNAVRNEDWHLFDVYGGLYALCNVHEFVSEFISNPIARSNLYALAKEIDDKSARGAMSRLKHFVNALFKLFVNKNLFSEQLTTDSLRTYEQYLLNYLNGVNPLSNNKKFTKQQLLEAYKNIDDITLNNDKISILKEKLHKGMIAIQKHDVRLGWALEDVGKKDFPIKDRYSWIKNSLQSRINAIQTSRLPQDTKTILMSETKGWLDQMNNPQVTIYESLSLFLNALGPRIIAALDDLDTIKFSNNPDAANYMYQAHDNIGTFDAIIRDISVILKNESEVQDIVAQFNEQNLDSQITSKELAELQTSAEELSSVLSTAKGLVTNLMNRVAVSTLADVATNAGSLEGVEMIQNMVSRNPVVEQDVSWFLVQFGLADASPNEIVRAVANMIQKANDRVDDLTLDKCIKLILLADALKPGESILDLYEVVDGKRTGFIVRPFNYGKHRKEYSEYIAELNKKFGLPEKNNMPPLDETEAILWELERQDFILKHGELRYVPKYYKAWAKVPKHVKEQIGKLNGAMIALLQKYDAIDKDGTRHYEKITNDDDWKLFLSLKMSKRLMRETHDRFGNEKHGTDLQDALVLLEVYKELYGTEYKQFKTRKELWNEAREKVIEQCGGHLSLDDYLNGYESSFDFKTFDKWESRNSKRDFKRLPSGKPKIFEDFEQEIHGMQLDYGEEYRQLKLRERSLLRPTYDTAGEVVPYLLEDSVKNVLLNEIYPRMKQIREQVISSTPGYAELAGHLKEAFDAYFKYVDTRYYRDILNEVASELYNDDDDDIGGYDDYDFAYALADYGYLFEDYETDFAYVVPYKWYQVLVAKDDEYMETVPNEAWLETDEERNYDNPVWKELGLDKLGLSVVPKFDLYKNEQWEKIENSPTLKALYDEIVSTMHEANQLLTNRQFTNDYLLPGVSAKLFDRLKLVKGIDKLTTFLKWAAESLGINIGQDQDVLLRNETTAHDENTEEGEPIYSLFTRTVGRRGDGREYTALPQYFTRRLDNPEFTSGALLDIVLSYYKMSVNYNEKSKIKDLCDAILDYVKDRNYYSGISQKTVDDIKKYLNVKGADSTEMSNVYKQLKNLIDFGLYGKVKIQFKTKWFDFSKVIDVTRRLTTATNLGMNPKVAAVGYMTAMHAHIINALVGKEYPFMSIVEAGFETVKHLIYNWKKHGFYSRKSQDKVLVLLEEFGIAQQLERKMTDLDIKSNFVGELLRAAKQNYTFGLLSTTDYLTKSLISIAVLKDYKYIDGEIYSNVDVEYMRYDKDKYKELRSKYKAAKSIYDNMKVKDGRIYFEDADMDDAWKNNFGRIKAKCVKLSERADGVATGLQRAAILSSWIGMIIMIHRQFLPLMLQERYGDRVYDYDMQEYKNGLFRVMYKFLSELMMNNFLAGAPTAMLALSFFISNPMWVLGIGTILSAGFRIYGASTGQHKSVKDIYNLFFNTFNDQKSTINSLENRWAMRLILAERGLIFLMSNLLVGPVCKWADDDKDDFWLLTFAYWLKGSKWEINGPYNIEELVANIKSPTAMTSLLDRFNAVAANNNSGILNWLSSLSLTEEEKVINRNSPYAGWTHTEQSWFKALSGPFSNIYELSKAVGVYGKRKWMERLNFHEHSGDNRDVYEDTRNLFNSFSE